MERSDFIQDIHGTLIWNPMMEAHDACEWTGPSRYGYASGFGTLVWYVDRKPVSTYVGHMRQGKFHGKGICNFADGDKYDGDWHEGLRHGYGVQTFKDGTVYKGRWERNTRKGALASVSR
jgi:hypothetical protein